MILIHNRFVHAVSTASLRKWFKSKTDAGSLCTAVEQLETVGLVSVSEAGPSRGHPVSVISKRSWTDMRCNEATMTYLKKINDPQEVFEG